MLERAFPQLRRSYRFGCWDGVGGAAAGAGCADGAAGGEDVVVVA